VTCAAAESHMGLLPPVVKAKAVVESAVVAKRMTASCILTDVIVSVDKVIELMTKVLISSKCWAALHQNLLEQSPYMLASSRFVKPT
jgi:hypothetical protein